MRLGGSGMNEPLCCCSFFSSFSPPFRYHPVHYYDTLYDKYINKSIKSAAAAKLFSNPIISSPVGLTKNRRPISVAARGADGLGETHLPPKSVLSRMSQPFSNRSTVSFTTDMLLASLTPALRGGRETDRGGTCAGSNPSVPY